jgi:hypothetical protein
VAAKGWYLMFQTADASYATNPDIGDSNGWSTPKNVHSSMPGVIS